MNTQDPKPMIDFLNKALKIDQEAITNLFTNSVCCNKEMAEHESIQVDSRNKVRFLGILNGFYGIAKNGPLEGFGPITVVHDGDTGRIIGFELTSVTVRIEGYK